MFSVRQKRAIADKVQQILRNTHHQELPDSEILFLLRVEGAQAWSFAEIRNNGAVVEPGINAWNEMLDRQDAVRFADRIKALLRKLDAEHSHADRSAGCPTCVWIESQPEWGEIVQERDNTR